MKFTKDKGFVIRRVNYKDADRILTIYTQNNGKIDILAKGVRKTTSKRASYTELLNHLVFESVTGKRGLVLTDTRLIASFSEKRQTLKYLSSMFYIAEIIYKLCPYEEKNENIYFLLKDFLDSENGTHTISEFQRSVLVYLGYWKRNDKVTNVSELNKFIENIIEKKLHSHRYL